MSELLIEHIADGDLLRTHIKATMAEIRLCAERVTAASAAIHANTTWTEGQRHLESEKVSARAVTPVLEHVDRTRSRLEAEIAGLKQKTSGPAVESSVKANFMAGEVRARLASMSQAERLSVLHKAIKDGDDSVIGFALDGPLMLTGLSATERENVRMRWAVARHPDLCKRMAQLEKDHDHLARAGGLLLSHSLKMASPAITTAAKKLGEAAQAAIAKAGASTN
jgi:hypothetical protein